MTAACCEALHSTPFRESTHPENDRPLTWRNVRRRRRETFAKIRPRRGNSTAPLFDFLELLQNGRIFQCRHVLRDRLVLGERAQQPSHDLAGPGLRQVVAEADVLGLRDRSDFLADPIAEVLVFCQECGQRLGPRVAPPTPPIGLGGSADPSKHAPSPIFLRRRRRGRRGKLPSVGAALRRRDPRGWRSLLVFGGHRRLLTAPLAGSGVSAAPPELGSHPGVRFCVGVRTPSRGLCPRRSRRRPRSRSDFVAPGAPMLLAGLGIGPSSIRARTAAPSPPWRRSCRCSLATRHRTHVSRSLPRGERSRARVLLGSVVTRRFVRQPWDAVGQWSTQAGGLQTAADLERTRRPSRRGVSDGSGSSVGFAVGLSGGGSPKSPPSPPPVAGGDAHRRLRLLSRVDTPRASARRSDPLVPPVPGDAPVPPAAACRPPSPTYGRLVVITKDGGEGPSYPLGEQLDIGRTEGQRRHRRGPLPLPAPRPHRAARQRDGDAEFFLRDLGSTNGVFVRLGKRRSRRRPQASTVPLQDQDLFLVGQQVLRFEVVKDAEEGFGAASAARHAALRNARRTALRSPEPADRRGGHARRLPRPQSGDRHRPRVGRHRLHRRSVPLAAPRCSIRRRAAAQKRVHSLADLGSSNGTFLQIREEVSPAARRPLPHRPAALPVRPRRLSRSPTPR